VVLYDLVQIEDPDYYLDSDGGGVASEGETYSDSSDSDDYYHDYYGSRRDRWIGGLGGQPKLPKKYLRMGSESMQRLQSAVSVFLASKSPSDAVAFFLQHRYSLATLDSSSVLKGADNLLFEAFAGNEKLKLTLCGVIVSVRTDFQGRKHTSDIRVHEITMHHLLYGNKNPPPTQQTKVFVVCDKNNTSGFRVIGHRPYKPMGYDEMGFELDNVREGYDAYYHTVLVIQPKTSSGSQDSSKPPPASSSEESSSVSDIPLRVT